jgi:hypothetical protein
MLARHAPKVCDPAEQRHVPHVDGERPGCVVEETHRGETVLGMLEQLAGDQLTDLPGSQNQRLLYEAGLPARDRARDRTAERQQYGQRDRAAEYHRQPGSGFSATPRRGAGQEPAERERAPDRGHVVRRGLVRADLIGSVEAREGEDADQGDRARSIDRHAVAQRGLRGDPEVLDQREGAEQGGSVPGEQQPADEPASLPRLASRSAAALHHAQRLRVDRRTLRTRDQRFRVGATRTLPENLGLCALPIREITLIANFAIRRLVRAHRHDSP